MYMFDHEIANRIAATQEMATEEMKLWFEASDVQVKDMEKEKQVEILRETGDDIVAAAVVAFLPLLAENKAISRYINYTGDYDLRVQIPEIITAEEAGLFAEMEFSLNPEQTSAVTRIIDQKCAGLTAYKREKEDFISFP
jgi:hypothetical protein